MRKGPTLVAGLLLLLTAAACEGDKSAPQACANPTATTTIVMEDFFYEPNCLALDGGATVSLDNPGAAPHTFTLEGTEVNADVAAGEKGSADLAGVAPGLYSVICTYHPQMVAVAQIA
jgi:plastocyanin